MSTTRRTKGSQQGPRSRRILADVRSATFSELARVGYVQLSVEAVAKQAGVHKTTIYRRWPSKSDLVRVLVEDELATIDAAPALDDLRLELIGLATQVFTNLERDGGRALARVLMSNHPDLMDVLEQARQQTLRRFAQAFDRAQARGELAADADVQTLTLLAFLGLMHVVLASEGAVDVAALTRVLAPLLPPH